MMPQRIQLQRTKGWRMPAGTVKVDRTTQWGNPYRAGMFADYTAADAVRDFREWITGNLGHRSAGKVPSLEPLRGKALACWCKPGTPCHADVLLELANLATGGVAHGTSSLMGEQPSEQTIQRFNGGR